jgi:hypothetical protein
VLAQAQIEIVNDAGQIEDRVSIVGAGEVGLATRDRCELQVVSPEQAGPQPDAVIVLRDGAVFVEARAPGTLRVNGKELGRAERMAVEHELIAHIVAMHRRLRVRTFLFATASLLSAAGAVIRTKPTPLEAWSVRAAARGARKVSEHLARLRANGSIDDNGKLLVPLPADMNPDAPTDV